MKDGEGPRSFSALYYHEPDAVAEAPGRINLIGEHTDYNGGLVLPTATPQRTRVELARRRDSTARLWSSEADPAAAPRAYAVGDEQPVGNWTDYVQGVTASLHASGYDLPVGFDLRVTTEIPLGSGLASSAALEVALLRGLRLLFDLPLDDLTIATIAHHAETDFVGAPVGVMDQVASSMGEEQTALYLDTRSMAIARVPIPEALEIVVIHSGIVHQHAGGEYTVRRRECERAAELLGVAQLRDLDEADLDRIAALPEPLARRARHVVTENARVVTAVMALRRGELARLGALINASHASLRGDFAVSTPEIDRLVELAQAEPGVYGARLTGGGFGGAILALVPVEQGHGVAMRVATRYAAETGKRPTVMMPRDAAR